MNESEFSRRAFLQGGAATAGAAVTGSVLAEALAPAKASRRPNILFLYNEGQRSDALGMTGNGLARTPNMDQIAREGVYFSNSFCTNALCAPARGVALTGVHSHTSGGVDNKTTGMLRADVPLFTDLLHEADYDVAMVGKAHVKNGVRERYWDYYCAFDKAVTDFYAPSYFEGRKGVMGKETTYRGKARKEFPENPAMDFEGVYADDFFTDKALDWLKEERTRPFCLCLWQQAPHSPYYRPRKYLDLFNDIKIPKPATFDDDLKGYPGKPRCFADATNKIGTVVTGDGVRSLEELVKNYYSGLAAVDDNIGRVLSYLEKTGQLDDTILLVSSDHGYFLGEWRCFDKRFMHEPSLRTPTMIRYPAKFKAGTKVDEMVLNLDFAPTLLELAGVPVPATMQGKSLVKLSQKAQTEWRSDWLYEYFDYPGAEQVRPHRGIRTARYKYIHYFLSPAEYELYDLQTDPGERTNLYGRPEQAEIQRHLVARLEELRVESGDHVGGSVA